MLNRMFTTTVVAAAICVPSVGLVIANIEGIQNAVDPLAAAEEMHVLATCWYGATKSLVLIFALWFTRGFWKKVSVWTLVIALSSTVGLAGYLFSNVWVFATGAAVLAVTHVMQCTSEAMHEVRELRKQAE